MIFSGSKTHDINTDSELELVTWGYIVRDVRITSIVTKTIDTVTPIAATCTVKYITIREVVKGEV